MHVTVARDAKCFDFRINKSTCNVPISQLAAASLKTMHAKLKPGAELKIQNTLMTQINNKNHNYGEFEIVLYIVRHNNYSHHIHYVYA